MVDDTAGRYVCPLRQRSALEGTAEVRGEGRQPRPVLPCTVLVLPAGDHRETARSLLTRVATDPRTAALGFRTLGFRPRSSPLPCCSHAESGRPMPMVPHTYERMCVNPTTGHWRPTHCSLVQTGSADTPLVPGERPRAGGGGGRERGGGPPAKILKLLYFLARLKEALDDWATPVLLPVIRPLFLIKQVRRLLDELCLKC